MVNVLPAIRTLLSWRLALLGSLFLLVFSACTPTPEPFFTPTPEPTEEGSGASEPASLAPAGSTEDPIQLGLLTREAEDHSTLAEEFPTITPYRSSTPFPTYTMSPTRTPAPTGVITTYGAWGLIPTREGLWAMGADGSGLTLLTNDPIYHLSVSPTNRMAAYITHPNPDNFAFEYPLGYTLKIVTIPDGRIFDIVSLDMQGITPDSSYEELERAYQAISVFDHGGLVWSPGGYRLAFSSAHEGSAADVYFYTPSDGKISRFASGTFPNGPAHAYGFRWSPDGRKLFYARAYNFGAGDGFWMAGAWVNGLDGSNIQVADETYTGIQLIDWPRNHDVLLASWFNDCGNQNLRLVNTVTGTTQVYTPYCFEDYVYDRRRGEILVSVPEDMAAFQDGSQPGLFLFWTWMTEEKRISEKGFEKLFRGDVYANWYGYNRYEGLFTIQRNGNIQPLFTGPPYDNSTGVQMSPYYHPTGETAWLWSGDGFYLAQPGQEPVLISPVAPRGFTPSPNRNDLYFFYTLEAEGPRLYSIRSGEWIAHLVDDKIQPEGIQWVR